jgi:hypothetical protein
MGIFKDMSDEYLLHQAREFHTIAVNRLTPGLVLVAVVNLCAAVEYLIELEEKRQGVL